MLGRFFWLFFSLLTVWTCSHHDRAYCSASRIIKQTALTILVPLSVPAGLEPFSLSLQLMISLTVQQQHERKIVLDAGNHSYLWGLLKELCTFYGPTFLVEVLWGFFFPSCTPVFSILGNVYAKYLFLLLCPTCSKILFSPHKWFLPLPITFIKSFLCSAFTPVFKWISPEFAGQISLRLSQQT